ncbi:MAG: 30S ribosomal protein S4 [Candidatus Argoarchaeum ethanivorans]|uniref:Small ribosomal subunit protein uS4 n=1 Tax=Candidatus Argoarchaeum ethanivorans TaxID=2608793 RepID=A0A811TFI8_9EURY|nr:MAG: 30S ribosomal protein S4 [Candidatus Argoarchaeum ethanivorans]
MGYPGKNRKSYETPKHPWQKERIAGEVDFIKTYGLRNKKEVWKAHTILKKYRQAAMRLLAETAKGEVSTHIKRETNDILTRLKKYGILSEEGSLDAVLALEVPSILERRLQTQAHKQGITRTKRQARQFVVHGHVAVNGCKITVPGYMLTKDEEMHISYYTSSPLNSEDHPERPEKVIQTVALETTDTTQEE